MSLIANDKFTWFILSLNTLLLLNRTFQRFYFVSRYYGYVEGFLSILRLFWGNVINFSANIRAIRQVIEQGDPRRVAWDKTTHDFPSISVEARKVPLGQILVRNGYMSQLTLDDVILGKPQNVLMGMYLVREGYISNRELSIAMAEQCEARFLEVEPFHLSKDIISKVPKNVALKYSILPIAMEGDTLVIGKESALSPVALSAIKRRLGLKVHWVVTTNGAVTAGLRYWYLKDNSINPHPVLETAVSEGRIDCNDKVKILDSFFATQCQLGTCLLSARLIEGAVLNQAILAYEGVEGMSLGRFLTKNEYLKQEDIETALDLQRSFQTSINKLVDGYCSTVKIG